MVSGKTGLEQKPPHLESFMQLFDNLAKMVDCWFHLGDRWIFKVVPNSTMFESSPKQIRYLVLLVLKGSRCKFLGTCAQPHRATRRPQKRAIKAVCEKSLCALARWETRTGICTGIRATLNPKNPKNASRPVAAIGVFLP